MTASSMEKNVGFRQFPTIPMLVFSSQVSSSFSGGGDPSAFGEEANDNISIASSCGPRSSPQLAIVLCQTCL